MSIQQVLYKALEFKTLLNRMILTGMKPTQIFWLVNGFEVTHLANQCKHILQWTLDVFNTFIRFCPSSLITTFVEGPACPNKGFFSIFGLFS